MQTVVEYRQEQINRVYCSNRGFTIKIACPTGETESLDISHEEFLGIIDILTVIAN